MGSKTTYRSQDGTTLLEIIIGVGLIGGIAAISMGGWANYNKASNRQDAIMDAQSTAQLAIDRLTKYWSLRAHPTPVAGNTAGTFTAQNPGFLPGSNQLTMYLSTDQSQWVEFKTQCKPVIRPSLATKDFSAASSCVRCPLGQEPMLSVTSGGLANGPSLTLPTGNGGSTERTISASACFQPYVFGDAGSPVPSPLSVVFQMGTLASSGSVAVTSRVIDLPLDNFAGVVINQAQ